MFSKPDFLTSNETYEKYEKSHNRNIGAVPISLSTVTPVTYFNEYKVITRTPVPQNEVILSVPTDQTMLRNNLQPLRKKQIPFGRIVAAAIGIPLFIMFFLFIAIWFQELGFI